MEHQAIPNSWIMMTTSGWIVAILVLAYHLVTRHKSGTGTISTDFTPEPSAPTGIDVNRADADTSAPPPQPKPEEPVLSPAELVDKYWPSGDGTNVEKATSTLEEVQQHCRVEWDEDIEYDEPSPKDFVTLLSARGCSTTDLLIAFYDQTSYRLGELMTKVIDDVPVTVEELAAAIKQGDIEFDTAQLRDILEADALSMSQIFQLGKQLGLSGAEILELYGGDDEDYPDSDVYIAAARSEGYTDAQLLEAINVTSETHPDTIEVASRNNIPIPTIAQYLLDQNVDPSDLSDGLRDSNVTFEDGIDVLYLMIHPELLAPTTMAEPTPDAAPESPPAI